MFLQSYQASSRSATLLKQELRDLITTERIEATHVLNWGKGNTFLVPYGSIIINDPYIVKTVVDKVQFFRCVENLPDTFTQIGFPKAFYSKESVVEWMRANPGKDVVCRTLTQSRDGNGIVITSNPDEVPDCKLYTVYIKKLREYRAHVFMDSVIRVQQKKRSSNAESSNPQIRNTANGWIFATEGVDIPGPIKEACVEFVRLTGLQFGALDLIHNAYYNKWYILECNSAPGIMGTTVQAYGNAIRNFLEVH